ncbi:GMC family oxidoreductase [Chitinophaga qingshengii]|uniref:GMC family oxidoreductase n=1 Tax=Chitinophaga qingshengii TaxID=1569794 RepID=A0ABR7TNI5_9BACT|nr:GMC family oxidoreductase [Chitinophaga qingshengii]MBC9931195.1 GMC family oxidoreductase [Chitinophaga qingshengii]
MENTEYDVIIVGSGIAGCVMAKTLTQAGKKVLLLEAGLSAGINLDKNGNFYNYVDYLNTYYKANAKVPNSPYPNIKDAPSPNVLDIQATPSVDKGYYVQEGELPFASDFLRGPGGTTLHWLGSTPRMLPNDFQMKTNYNVAVDWPITYNELVPYYEMAELEIGVAGDASVQPNANEYTKGYEFPMKKIPQSYLDQKFMALVDKVNKGEHPVQIDKKKVTIGLTSTPQGRNAVPNEKYPYIDVMWNAEQQKLVMTKHMYWSGKDRAFKELDKKEKYQYLPVGAVWDPNTGQRCEGNASCVPICPVQAKYNALKSLAKADESKLTIKTQSVASKVLHNGEKTQITGVVYKTYAFGDDAIEYKEVIATAKIYVLAANAIENAKILLASEAANSSKQVGCNLMDHLCLLTWGLLPEKGYPFRGPGSTTNISSFRDTDTRKDHSAWICPVDNWGWGWPKFSPGSDVQDAVKEKKFGKELRNHLSDVLPRQLLLHYECEQLPNKDNRVSIKDEYRDALGNHRPVIKYNVSDYEIKAFAAAKAINDQLFKAAGIKDFTKYGEKDENGKFKNPDIVTPPRSKEIYNFWGAGHIVGTHRMGKDADKSVVDKNLCTWDHNNLYLVGCGNMPTLGTSNPTLTMLALTFKAAEAILKKI